MICAKKDVDVDKVVAVRGMRSGQIRGILGWPSQAERLDTV